MDSNNLELWAKYVSEWKAAPLFHLPHPQEFPILKRLSYSNSRIPGAVIILKTPNYSQKPKNTSRIFSHLQNVPETYLALWTRSKCD